MTPDPDPVPSTFPAITVPANLPLSPAPFEKDQRIEGDLSPRSATLASRADGAPFTVGVFACNPGAVFDRPTLDETLYVLEGEVEISFDDGHSIVLVVGDVGVIASGRMATWTFRSPFKELYVVGR